MRTFAHRRITTGESSCWYVAPEMFGVFVKWGPRISSPLPSGVKNRLDISKGNQTGSNRNTQSGERTCAHGQEQVAAVSAASA